MAVAGAERRGGPLVAVDGPTTWRWATVLVTAGALTAAVLLAPIASGTPSRLLAWLLFLGSSVHVASTGWFFKSEAVRRHAATDDRRYLIALPLCFVIGCTVAAFVMPAASLPWILLPFFAWQFHHFQKQNIGLVALSASSARVIGPKRLERRIVILAGIFGFAALIADPALLQLHVYRPIAAMAALSFGGYLLVVAAGMFVLLRRPGHLRPPSYCAMYVMALLFPLPIFVFSSPYAAVGGMTIGHGLQYLILVGLVALGGNTARPVRREFTWFCGIALAGGAVLSAASHLHLSNSALIRAVFGLYLGLVCAHFLVDARIWRLSRPFPRAFLGSRIAFLVVPKRQQLGIRLPIDRIPI